MNNHHTNTHISEGHKQVPFELNPYEEVYTDPVESWDPARESVTNALVYAIIGFAITGPADDILVGVPGVLDSASVGPWKYWQASEQVAMYQPSEDRRTASACRS